MPDRLFAFMEGTALGVFEQAGPASASFAYEPSYSGTPMSLSMPPGERTNPEVAFAYLDGLLPEDEDYRKGLAVREGVSPTTFGLLSRLGEDVAGAVVLSTDENLPVRQPAPLIEASEDDIAYRVASLKRDPHSLPDRNTPMRFSLAGQQAKFSLAKISDQWFWSTAEMPSTHIFKPPFERHLNAESAEHAMLDLARELGVPASRSQVMSFRGQQTFSTERWDRAGRIRIHAEDLLQAFGDPMTDKYGMYADDARKLTSKHGLEEDYLRQVLFNVAVGNSDAHAKNYSFLLAGDQVRLAPLYDCLPIFLWPQYDQTLCLSVNGKTRLREIGRDDWVAWAKATGYDPDIVLGQIDNLFPRVSDRLPGALADAGIPPEGVELAKQHVDTLADSLLSRGGTKTSTASAKCTVCGRELTSPESIARGCGKVCSSKV